MGSLSLFETENYLQFQKDCVGSETRLDVINDYMSFNRWIDISRGIGQSRAKLENIFKWWIGDFVNFGNAKFGDTIYQFIDSFGIAYESINKYCWVCKNTPKELRCSELSFTHHEIVAAIKDKRTVELLLRKAIQEKMNLVEFRSFVRAQHEPISLGKHKIKAFYQTLRFNLERSYALLCASQLTEMTARQKNEIYQAIQPILSFSSELEKDVRAAAID